MELESYTVFSYRDRKKLVLVFEELPFTPEELIEEVRKKSPKAMIWSSSGQPVTGATYMGKGLNKWRRDYYANIPGSIWERSIHEDKGITYNCLYEIWQWARSNDYIPVDYSAETAERLKASCEAFLETNRQQKLTW
jgi:hypothetical protein